LKSLLPIIYEIPSQPVTGFKYSLWQGEELQYYLSVCFEEMENKKKKLSV
jgi:hypothetical protein